MALPAAEIESEIESRLKRLSRTVKLHGFRPGKVPLKVVARQFGPQVRQEVVGDALQKSFGEHIRTHNLRVAGYPKFEVKPQEQGATQLEYSATFEIFPDIVVGDISQAVIERPTLEVGDAEVDKTIEIMRRQRTRFEPVAREARNDDRLVIDFRGTIDGAEFKGSTATGQQVLLGGGRLLPEFEGALAGMKAGDTKRVEVRFPDDYHGAEVAGKTAVFEITVREVAEPRLPEVDAEFAKALGIEDGDLSRMREEIRANLEREVRAKIKARVRDQVMNALVEATRIEAPKSLVREETERLKAGARQELALRGIPVKGDTPLPDDVFEKQAERRVVTGLILGEVMKQHGLYPKPEQVRALVEEQAQAYEHPQEVVKWYYAEPGRLRDIETAAAEENIVNWALGVAKVTDKAIGFDELMGNA